MGKRQQRMQRVVALRKLHWFFPQHIRTVIALLGEADKEASAGLAAFLVAANRDVPATADLLATALRSAEATPVLNARLRDVITRIEGSATKTGFHAGI